MNLGWRPELETIQTVIPAVASRLLDRIHERNHTKPFASITERTYLEWIRCYIFFHDAIALRANAQTDRQRISESLFQMKISNRISLRVAFMKKWF